MAHLSDAARFALSVALGVAYILKPILDFLNGVSPRNPILDAAVAVVLLTLPITYLLGVILLQLHDAPAPAASRRFAHLACTMVSALLAGLAVLLIAFMLLAGLTPGGDR